MSARDYIHFKGDPYILLCNSPTDEENDTKAVTTTNVKSMVTCWRCIMQLLGRELPKMPELPEHAKLKAAKEGCADATQLVFNFIEWLGEHRKYIAEYGADGELHDVYDPPAKLIADFFEIDRNKVDDEKNALLDYQRKLNAAREWAETEGKASLQ